MAAYKSTWSLLVITIILFVFSNSKLINSFDDPILSREEDLELERQLKLLNKPPIKTFQTKEGDIMDCVDINDQPALHHPSLKNHKVQVEPSAYLLELVKAGSPSSSSETSKADLFLNKKKREESCPVGFVPIRRTLKKDLIRLRSKPESPNHHIKAAVIPNAIMFPYDKNVVSLAMNKEDTPYYGVNAHIAVYSLSLPNDQGSSSNVWVIGGPPESLNVILAGWQVNTPVNGDNNTRMFIYWTADAGARTGCYNMFCPGFVQVDRTRVPYGTMSPVSEYRGTQNDNQFIVNQDRETGNWWFLLGDLRTPLGYFPKELFGFLKNGAAQVGWGGIASPGHKGVSPPLGNSHFPEDGRYDLACYFRNIRYVNGDNQVMDPLHYNTTEFVSNSDCYGLDNDNMNKCGDEQMYYCFTYGGPGGKDCTRY